MSGTNRRRRSGVTVTNTPFGENATTGYFLEDLTIGMSATYARTITSADVTMFAAVSGDLNPIHLDEDYAAASVFGGRIVHGMLSASFLSAAIGMQLPGPGAIYISQALRFCAPVRIGDTVEALVTVAEIVPERKRILLRTVCTVDGTVVIEGDA